jgi:hypothetical protein
MPCILGTPRPPLGEISFNKRSRICGARDAGIKFAVIARAIYKNAENQVSCHSRKRTGRSTLVTDRDQRAIFRELAQVVPHLSEKTIYRFLKKSGIQKWYRQRPLLTVEYAEKRLRWSQEHNGKPPTFWCRVRWSDECSIERGKGGQTE